MLAESKSVGKVGDMDTSVPGVFAAGDLSAQMPQVADQLGLPVPPSPIEKEDADAHA
jgi:hypothetical protein